MKKNLILAAEVFRNFFPDLDAVTCIEFESTGPMQATAWLGEPREGMRGHNHTSLDAAGIWNDRSGRQCAPLIEWKYTEHNFGICDAYAHGDDEIRYKCESLNVAEDENPAQLCF